MMDEDSRTSPTTRLRPQTVAAVAAVAVGALGLVALARSSTPVPVVETPRRRRRDDPRTRRDAKRGGTPVERDVRTTSAFCVVVDAFGLGSRARVFPRGRTSGPPVFEAWRNTDKAALLEAMNYVRKQESEAG